jgi:hypothetical protein
MHTQRVVFASLLVILLLGGGVNLAQGPDTLPTAPDALGPSPDAVLDDGIPVQGRLTDSSGVPLSGSYALTLSLYDVTSGGSPLCSEVEIVTVADGLFTATLDGCTGEQLDGRQLYLGIRVGADPQMSPRLPVYAAPYAMGLRPGAKVVGSGSGRTLALYGTGDGEAGTTLWAENTGPYGIAIWARAAGAGAPLVLTNTGNGWLLKAFGRDGGEDEFRIDNGGAIQTKADSYVWVPGNAVVPTVSGASVDREVQLDGGVKLWRNSQGPLYQSVFLPITLPSVLYGQSVRIESVQIFYRSQLGRDSYIVDTVMYRHNPSGEGSLILWDTSDQAAETYTSYTVLATGDNRLSPTEGGVGLLLGIRISHDAFLQIGGASIRLGHHELY